MTEDGGEGIGVLDDPAIVEEDGMTDLPLASGGLSDLGVDLWDCQSGRLLYSLPEQEGLIYYFAWSPDGRRLAVSRSNGAIDIWNLAEVERVLSDLGLAP